MEANLKTEPGTRDPETAQETGKPADGNGETLAEFIERYKDSIAQRVIEYYPPLYQPARDNGAAPGTPPEAPGRPGGRHPGRGAIAQDQPRNQHSRRDGHGQDLHRHRGSPRRRVREGAGHHAAPTWWKNGNARWR